jgi:hypothetical protein
MIIIELNFTGFSITETWYFVTLKKKKSMKKVLFSVLISSFTLLFPLLSKAQAGIFKVRLMVDKALTSSVMITTANQSVNAYSNFRFPSNLQDSIKLAIQKTAKTQLFKDATYIYDLKADGSKRATLETGTYAGGYPKMTKKRAVFGYEEELYVKVKIKVQGYKGPAFGAMGVQYSNIHPTVKFKMKAFGTDKKKIYSRKIRLWDFDKISSVVYTSQFGSVTNTNALNAEQIYQMIKHTLLVFNEEEERNR